MTPPGAVAKHTFLCQLKKKSYKLKNKLGMILFDFIWSTIPRRDEMTITREKKLEEYKQFLS